MNKSLVFLCFFSLIGVSFLSYAEVSPPCVPLEPCNIEKLKKAELGYTCQVSSCVSWSVEAKTLTGKNILLDQKSGILVTDVLDGRYNQFDAKKQCSNFKIMESFSGKNWGLPTGYPKEMNGKECFPDRDSEFETLEKDGIRQVLDIFGNTFWSSSVYPYSKSVAYEFHGNYGYVFIGYRYDKIDHSVLCVGRQ